MTIKKSSPGEIDCHASKNQKQCDFPGAPHTFQPTGNRQTSCPEHKGWKARAKKELLKKKIKISSTSHFGKTTWTGSVDRNREHAEGAAREKVRLGIRQNRPIEGPKPTFVDLAALKENMGAHLNPRQKKTFDESAPRNIILDAGITHIVTIGKIRLTIEAA